MLRAIALVACLLVPRFVLGASVFLNGVNIDGVTNQQFNNCVVTLDAVGNVLITARGYAVNGQAGAPSPAAVAPQGAQGAPGYAPPVAAPPAPAPVAPQAAAAQAYAPPPAVPTAITHRYWLVTEKAAPGMTQYNFDVFINSKFVRRFLDDEEHVVLEITKFLQPGQNKVVLMAKKNLAQDRRSTSPQHYFRLIIGAGDAGGRNVMISQKLLDYKRTAAETKDFSDEIIIVGN